jgi:RNA polymerase sigma factor (sigma-70 family)
LSEGAIEAFKARLERAGCNYKNANGEYSGDPGELRPWVSLALRDCCLEYRFAEGHQSALSDIILRDDSWLTSQLAKVVRGVTYEPQDISQEVWRRLWVKLTQTTCGKGAMRYDPGRPFRPWILKVAIRRNIDEFRRRMGRPVLSLNEEMLPASEPTQVERAIVKDQIRRLKDGLGKLSEAERDVLYRRFYRGQSYEEIRNETNIPVGTLGSRLQRALEKLRRELG